MDSDREVEKKFKTTVVGDISVGKSQIINRYVNHNFSDEYRSTVGADYKSKNLSSHNVRYQIWDAGGQEKFYKIVSSYIRYANAVCIVVDMTLSKDEQIESMKKWIGHAKGHASLEAKFYFIGNKLDLSSDREECKKTFSDAVKAVNDEQKKKSSKLMDMKIFRISAAQQRRVRGSIIYFSVSQTII